MRGSMMIGGGRTPGSTEQWHVFEGPDQANDCRIKINSLSREASREGRVLTGHEVLRKDGRTTLIARSVDAAAAGSKRRKRT